MLTFSYVQNECYVFKVFWNIHSWVRQPPHHLMLVRSYLNISVSIFAVAFFFIIIFLIIFNFFFLFIPFFFSLQELLCALRVKSRLRDGGWLVGWLVCFLRPFQTFTDFLSTLCWKKCQGPSRNSKHLLY